LLETEIN